MTPRFTVLPSEDPDSIDLELLELGAVPDPSDRAAIEGARSGPLADTDRELADARAFFAAHAAPLPSKAARQPRPFGRGFPLLALAAALLLVIGLSVGRGPADPPPRPMGGLGVEMAVVREGHRIAVPRSFEPSDEVHVALRSPEDGFLDVWTRQADGTVSELLVGYPVVQGVQVTLPGAIRLDPYPEEEWLMMRVTPSPTASGGLVGVSLDELRPGTSFSVEVTRTR